MEAPLILAILRLDGVQLVTLSLLLLAITKLRGKLGQNASAQKQSHSTILLKHTQSPAKPENCQASPKEMANRLLKRE